MVNYGDMWSAVFYDLPRVVCSESHRYFHVSHCTTMEIHHVSHPQFGLWNSILWVSLGIGTLSISILNLLYTWLVSLWKCAGITRSFPRCWMCNVQFFRGDFHKVKTFFDLVEVLCRFVVLALHTVGFFGTLYCGVIIGVPQDQR
jgi:hypothetical protein